MLSVTRYRVPVAAADTFVADALRLVQALVGRPGFVAGRVARAVDDPQLWVLATEWVDVGSYRRAVSPVEVRVREAALQGHAADGPADPTGFELLASVDAAGTVTRSPSAANPDV